MLQEPSAFAKEDQAKKDAFDESDDESAISRTESELREVTKVTLSTTLIAQPNLAVLPLSRLSPKCLAQT